LTGLPSSAIMPGIRFANSGGLMTAGLVRRAVVLWAVVLAACTVQLAPAYDQALAEGLDATNTQALTLFASLENGSPASEFGGYEQRYAELIGRFEALRQRALTRQVPPLARRLSSLRIAQSFCNSENDPTACVNASPSSLQEVLSLLRRMRDRHRSSGIEGDTVAVFRASYDVAIAQALTVENALRR
jgi:hypothetical protein